MVDRVYPFCNTEEMQRNLVGGAYWHGNMEDMRRWNVENVDIWWCGRTPLMLAVSNGRVHQVELLLQCNANVSARTERGETPLHFAAASVVNGTEVVMLLIDAGADTSAIDRNGMTPLMMAARESEGDPMVLDVLILNGASVNHRTRNGWTALHFAAHDGSPEAVRILLEHGADVMAVSKGGRTVHDMTQNQFVENYKPEIRALVEAEIDRVRNTAFAMGQHERLGERSLVRALHSEVVRMILHPGT
jgi:ankyrin repeat protein